MEISAAVAQTQKYVLKRTDLFGRMSNHLYDQERMNEEVL